MPRPRLEIRSSARSIAHCVATSSPALTLSQVSRSVSSSLRCTVRAKRSSRSSISFNKESCASPIGPLRQHALANAFPYGTEVQPLVVSVDLEAHAGFPVALEQEP